MSKKVYHIVDPETGKVVEEKDYGLFSRLLFWSASTKGKITFWVALGAVVLLCPMLAALEPSLPDAPAFFSVVRDIPFCVVVLVLLRVMLRFAARLGHKEPEPEPEEYYNIVDPVTGEVVDRISVTAFTQSQTASPEMHWGTRFQMAGFSCAIGFMLSLAVSVFIENLSEGQELFLDWSRPVLIIVGLSLVVFGTFLTKRAERHEPAAIRRVQETPPKERLGLTIQSIAIVCALLSITGFEIFFLLKDSLKAGSALLTCLCYIPIGLMISGIAGIYVGHAFIKRSEAEQEKRNDGKHMGEDS